ncbi:MAG: sulfotransferase domain-containing protein [Verrucomicrobiales bacterium]|nr:sulfotransferase domain-containing protein [Verrucomicrobiales bacterium]
MEREQSIYDFIPLAEGVSSQLSPTDRYFISFPRSGRTWIARALRIAIQITRNGSKISEPLVRECIVGKRKNRNLNEAGPDWKNPYAQSVNPGFLLTHSWDGLHPEARGPHLFLFRSPDDVMVSYFNYASFHGYIDPDKITLTDYARGNLPWWIAHTREALNRAANISVNKPSWKFLSYESFFLAPSAKLSTIAGYLGEEIPESDCRQILEILTPAFIKEVKGNYASLKAGPGSGTASLPGDVREEIETLAMPLYWKALKLEND